MPLLTVWKINCLTVIMFEEGIAHAKKLDEQFAKTGKTVGPLHGLPLSLKDNFNIKKYPSSVGFCSWALEPMKEESTIVSILRDLGAVAYVKTNVPTAMMIAESVNNCYGRCALSLILRGCSPADAMQNCKLAEPQPDFRRLVRWRVGADSDARKSARGRHRHWRQLEDTSSVHRHLHAAPFLRTFPTL